MGSFDGCGAARVVQWWRFSKYKECGGKQWEILKVGSGSEQLCRSADVEFEWWRFSKYKECGGKQWEILKVGSGSEQLCRSADVEFVVGRVSKMGMGGSGN